MSEQLRIADIKYITAEMKGEMLRELRKETRDINEMIKEGKSEIITVIFSESRKIRQEIGYQTIMLKILEDNLSEIQFDDETGISSKIEVSVGAEVFGTGAKWVLDIDIAKVTHSDLLRTIQQVPGIPEKVKKKLEKMVYSS